MGALLDQLWGVQQLQSELYNVKRERNRIAARLAERTKKLDDLKAALAAKRDEVKRKLVDMRTCETESKTRQEQVAALRVKLNNCRNQRDYSALLSEIATAEGENGRVTDRYVKLDEELKSAEKQAAELEAAAKIDDASVAVVTADSNVKLAELDKTLAVLAEDRSKRLADVPPAGRKIFDRLSDRHEGLAMALIELVDEADSVYACCNCNMSLTAEVTSAVFSADEVKSCPTCTKILYYQG